MKKRKGLRGLIDRLKSFFGFKNKKEAVFDETKLFTDRNVMVGTVRSTEQLEYNLSKNNYHVPAKFISKYNFPVKSIALYEDFEEFSGIRYVGEVESYNKIRRKNIAFPMSRDNPREEYYFFQVKSWSQLKNPICSVDTRSGPPMFTTEFLLNNCRKTYELFTVTSQSQYDLLCRINEFIDLYTKDENAHTKEYKVNEYYNIGLEFGDIVVYKKHIDVFTMPVTDYLEKQRRSFGTIKTIVETEDILKKFR